MEITAPLPEGTITLRDGRRLAYAEYGDPQGKPIFFFHGTPGSRLFHHPDASIAISAGARIIAIDRPGFGRSDFKAGRTLLDWPSDVLQLADAMNLQRFAVMGYSGGGPYAAVCASSIPERLTAVGLVSSIAPLDNPEIVRGMHGLGHMFFSLERHLPPLAKLGCQLMCTTWKHNPDLYFRSHINGLLSSAAAPNLHPQMETMLKADYLEAVRGGTQGIAWDLEILARPWGFHLHTIAANVYVWHGESDTQAPFVMGQRLASAIPHCHATFFQREGHWAVCIHWQEILTSLVQNQEIPQAEHESLPISTADTNANPDSDKVNSPAPAALTVIETPSDSGQGLPPARPAADTAAPAISQETAPEPTTTPQETPPGGSAALTAETAGEAQAPLPKRTAKRRSAVVQRPAVAETEPDQAQEAVKPPAKRTSKSSAVAAAKRAAATPEPQPTEDAVKPAARKQPKRSTAEVSETLAAVVSDPEPEQKTPRPASKKRGKRSTTEAAEASDAVVSKPEPAHKASHRTANKTTKSAAVSNPAPQRGETGELVAPRERASAAAKKPAKPKAVAVEPPAAVVAKEPASSSDTRATRQASKRKADKEPVLV